MQGRFIALCLDDRHPDDRPSELLDRGHDQPALCRLWRDVQWYQIEADDPHPNPSARPDVRPTPGFEDGADRWLDVLPGQARLRRGHREPPAEKSARLMADHTWVRADAEQMAEGEAVA